MEEIRELLALERVLADEYLLKKKFSEGIEYIDRELERLKREKSIDVFNLIEFELLKYKADFILQIGRFDEAINLLDFLLSKEDLLPRDELVLMQSIAQVHEKSGNTSEAVSVYRRALQIAASKNIRGFVASLLKSLLTLKGQANFVFTSQERENLMNFCRINTLQAPDFDSDQSMERISGILFERFYKTAGSSDM